MRRGTRGRLSGVALALAGVVAIAACGPGDRPSTGAFTVRDSIGVEIVESVEPLLAGDDAWTVSPEPVLRIGRLEGDEAYLFSGIWDAVRLPDGRLVISDREAYDIRVFSPQGEHLLSFGGRGEGPAEFGGPPWLALAPPDTLVVWDPGLYRLSRFDLEGELLDQISLQQTVADLSISRFVNGPVWDLRGDGGLLWTGPGPSPGGEGLNPQTSEFILVHGGGAGGYDFGDLPAGESYSTPRADGIRIGMSNDFAHRTEGALGPDPYRLALSPGRSWEVRLLGADGELRRIVRAPIPRKVVTDAMVDEKRAEKIERMVGSGLTRGQAANAFEELPVPDSVDAIGRVMFDVAGRLWVGRATEDPWGVHDYDVFDADGRWLTTLRLPEEIVRPVHVGDGHILAPWTDELDVPYLRVYRIRKPGG